jgi:hypothetical protein
LRPKPWIAVIGFQLNFNLQALIWPHHSEFISTGE